MLKSRRSAMPGIEPTPNTRQMPETSPAPLTRRCLRHCTSSSGICWSATKATVRAEVPQFSVRAVFEALVNAVAHRDYSIRGSRIRFHMFGDRLELYVPGGLANTLTTDNMDLRQYSRKK